MSNAKEGEPTSYFTNEFLPHHTGLRGRLDTEYCVSCGRVHYMPSYSFLIDNVLFHMCQQCDRLWDLQRPLNRSHYKRARLRLED
jgi:hypothetical protein